MVTCRRKQPSPYEEAMSDPPNAVTQSEMLRIPVPQRSLDATSVVLSLLMRRRNAGLVGADGGYPMRLTRSVAYRVCRRPR
jgi:hypothetical protein